MDVLGSNFYDCVIVGSGPGGLGAAYHLGRARRDLSVLVLDQEPASTGGLRNDCKMNFTYPIGFPGEYWSRVEAERILAEVEDDLRPQIMATHRIETYRRRAERLGVELLEIRQAHLGTDGGIRLARKLLDDLRQRGVDFSLGERMAEMGGDRRSIRTDRREIAFDSLIVAPGRRGFGFLQDLMDSLAIPYVDNVVDIGLRIETREENYPIVRDYYDPKFLFPEGVRTFCTNSNKAYVVKERYLTRSGREYFSINGHAFSADTDRGRVNGLVNFALLKTVKFTEPLASGQEFAEMLGQMAMLMGGGQPLMQRVGDFRLGKRSKSQAFTGDLYDFEPSLPGCTPGDISLAMPAKILRGIWKSLKLLDTILPGVMHPSTIMYYPEIKLYANKPRFIDECFQAAPGVYLVGDGAGTSRGITAAWASGIRAAEGILAARVGRRAG
jgi:uncharacterized FAD-dependent dehydrogenase